jgi:hypothetical protein
MKAITKLIISILLILIYSFSASAQKIMKLDSQLTANSQPMEAKRKGVSTIGKYQFGPYKIVSGKAGWTTSKSKSRLFSPETNTESKKKSTFVFVSDDKDTVYVNTTTNTSVNETSFGNWSNVNQSNENYIVLISPSNDTTEWEMIVVFKSGSEVEGDYKSDGILSDGTTNIEIRAVKQWEDGETATFNLILGYEFYLENQAVAALQASIDTFKKKYVWLDKNLSEHMKLVLASASASLLLHVDDEMAKQ